MKFETSSAVATGEFCTEGKFQQDMLRGLAAKDTDFLSYLYSLDFENIFSNVMVSEVCMSQMATIGVKGLKAIVPSSYLILNFSQSSNILILARF